VTFAAAMAKEVISFQL